MSFLYWGTQNWIQHSKCVPPGKVHLPQPAGNALPKAAQEVVGFLCHEYTLLAPGQLVVHQDSKVLPCRVALQLGGPLHAVVHGIISPQMQDYISLC